MDRRWRDVPACLAVGLLGLPCILLTLRAASQGAVWEELVGCRLVVNAYADGDSFRLRHGRATNVFRLAGVDTPETDFSFPERVQEQADWFGIRASDAVRLGEEAAAFTRSRLQAGCTVRTRWQLAPGMGASRYYAIVLVGRTNLAVELVRRGYARVHGLRSLGSTDPIAVRLVEELHAAEKEARARSRGGWDPRTYPRVDRPIAPGTSVTRPKTDLNSASVTELMRLPGIGAKLAERIVAARPFGSVLDIQRVQGIGPKTYAGLTNLVVVKPSVPARAPR